MGKVSWNNITWKKEFYSKLNMDDIKDADYMHGERVCIDIEII